ncbi:putative DNA helicase [Helianthus annuus]|nr:putative DNA helicase [Helianthus annuus]
MKVIVCRNCKYRLQVKLKEVDADCAECFCGWCGRSGDLLSCRSCKNLFCTSCIKKNLGEECLLKARDPGWQCCYCSPSILQPLTGPALRIHVPCSSSKKRALRAAQNSFFLLVFRKYLGIGLINLMG